MPQNNGYNVTGSGTNSQVHDPLLHTLQTNPSDHPLVLNHNPNSISIIPLTIYQGNHYCSRDYGSSASNSNSYHYSNRCESQISAPFDQKTPRS